CTHTAMFQFMYRAECYFINSTEKVRLVHRVIYNGEELMSFDSDVGRYVGFTHYGEYWAQYLNSDQAEMEYRRTGVDWFCRAWYEYLTFLVER
ncbi:2B11 protein, partial [Catharus fuscescens]|nr:2B11 protein [Catharus fuscescens]